MSKRKFYAVRKGRIPSIFLSWAEAKAQVAHFSGAEFKSFFSFSDAQDYMNYRMKDETTPLVDFVPNKEIDVEYDPPF